MSSITSATTNSTASTTSTSTSTTTSSDGTSTTTTDYASTDVSNIDWDGLIEELYQAKLDAADTYETKITDNEAKISAYEDAGDLLADLEDSVAVLRAQSGTLKDGEDVFASRTAYLTGVGGVDTDNTVSVTADDGADTGSYSLEIQQLATTHKIASESQSSSSDEIGLSGTITVGVDGGESVSVSIDDDMSLSEIAEAINNESDTSGVKATVLKVSDSSYQLVLSTEETGETIVVGDDDGVFEDLGVIDDNGDFTDVIQESQDAIFSIDGVTITRSSNDVDDVLDGVTLHLYSTTSDDESITIDIGQNLSDVEDAIETFVDAYNAYREWALGQQETSSSGGASENAVLFGDATIRSVNTSIASALTSYIDELSLSTLGLSFDENNYLELDTDTLEDLLLSDPDQVQTLFAYNFSSSSSDLKLLARGESAPSTFTLNVTVDSSGNLTGATVNGDSSLFTCDGSRIKGKTGTEYEGYTFVFTGDKSQSISVTQTSGIAEQIYNIAEGAINSDDGSLVNLVDSLTEKNDDYQDQIDNIESRAETYKDNLTSRYAKIQANISEAQSTLDYLEALLDSSNSD